MTATVLPFRPRQSDPDMPDSFPPWGDTTSTAARMDVRGNRPPQQEPARYPMPESASLIRTAKAGGTPCQRVEVGIVGIKPGPSIPASQHRHILPTLYTLIGALIAAAVLRVA